MGKIKNLMNRTFGRLTVLSMSNKREYGKVVWLCRCSCGKEVLISGFGLTQGVNISCGCFRAEFGDRMRTHGLTKTPMYSIWQGMKSRCFYPKNKRFNRYGGRGITVCKRWMKFENFLKDMGPIPFLGAQLDRKDNNGIYSKENCRWATLSAQANNRSSNVILTLRGETKTLTEWGRFLKINPKTLMSRKRYGWSTERILQK